MPTSIATFIRLCKVCFGPSTEEQGLVYEIGGYVHAACSNRNYQLVTKVSFPDDDPDPEPPTPASPALSPLGFDLCEYCMGLSRPFFPSELCPICQEAANEYEQDYYEEPDWDVQYERYQAAKDYLLAA